MSLAVRLAKPDRWPLATGCRGSVATCNRRRARIDSRHHAHDNGLMHTRFRLSYTALMAVLLALTACTLNQIPPTPVYQIVTPVPSATPPGPTPTPTIVPTATIAPQVALSGGDQAFLNGYYDEAVSA